LWEERAEESRAQSIVVCFTGREGEMDWQAVGIHDCVNLARQAPSTGGQRMMIWSQTPARRQRTKRL
jgi:hypothetical protein